MKIEKLSKYVDWAEADDKVIVFDTFEDYVKSLKDGQIYIDFFYNSEDAQCVPCIFKFVRTEEQAREFVKNAIEAGDEDYRWVQQYAEEQHYDGGAYGVLIGEWDGFARFSFTKQGYLFDNPLYD